MQPPSPACANVSYADYRPPKGHPLCRVFQPQPFELAYVSWGNRWYGDAPAAPQPHDGWHYFVVLAGSPVLLAAGRRHPTRPGFISICHPDTPVGHVDQPGRPCQMLTWVWRNPPAHPGLMPAAHQPILLHAGDPTLRRLKVLHEHCRQAVARACVHSLLQLRAARLQLELDLHLAEGWATGRGADPAFRFSLAIEYLRTHREVPNPVRHLCEYLDISEASLRRLFQTETRQSPRAYALDQRLRWARQQLETTAAPVKAIAYALGYRNPNDFSRAFKRHHGLAAHEVRDQRTDRPAVA
ncbi:MAG TPA: helix-turn-helix transcriptional regulator [Lacunisphaera sp.]|nr:helix-turn-helix transcriptional regulator [Lacunisphaera sp.]